MIEMMIVAAVVLWSAIVVFKKVFPKTSSSVFLSLSNTCAKRGFNTLAQWLQPAVVTGCGGNCGCDAQEPVQKLEVQAVKWK